MVLSPEQPNPQPIIEARNLGIWFRKNRRRKQRPLRERLRRSGDVGAGSDRFWALKGVTFSVQPGEAVGIVGANGQGKSTLLKLVAGVLLPDQGKIRVRTGVAPLIEVTGGFAGGLTARENIWLMSGLHGLSKKQITERFDSVVEFAEVGKSLDTPFRHFSSGMKVRLGFAVISSLDEPIILVDEVLAVGDRAFRDKCYDRMGALLDEGKTLFLVSHKEADLRRFCTRGIYLKRGAIAYDGDLEEALTRYGADVARRRDRRARRAAESDN